MKRTGLATAKNGLITVGTIVILSTIPNINAKAGNQKIGKEVLECVIDKDKEDIPKYLKNAIEQAKKNGVLEIDGKYHFLQDEDLKKVCKILKGEKITKIVIKNIPHIYVFPSEIYNFTTLDSISFMNSHISSMPDGIAKLQGLKHLDISDNKGTIRLPKDIGELKNLKSLDFSRTKIRKLPESFGNLDQLEILKLGENFVIFPGEIYKLTALKELDLSSTKIEAIDARNWTEIATLEEITLPKKIGETNLKEPTTASSIKIILYTNNSEKDIISNFVNYQEKNPDHITLEFIKE